LYLLGEVVFHALFPDSCRTNEMRGCSRVRIRSPWIQRRPDTDAALLWRKDSCYIWKLL